MAGARIGLRVAPEVLDADHRPPPLAACRGTVASLNVSVAAAVFLYHFHPLDRPARLPEALDE